MKCEVTVGELLSAIQLAKITMDRKVGSDFNALYLAAKRGKEGNERIILHSCDSMSRTLIRVNAKVSVPGELICDPLRLSAILEHRAADEIACFSGQGAGRVTVRVGGSRANLSSADAKSAAFVTSTELFPHHGTPIFSIGSTNLKALLDRTADFMYQSEGQYHFKNVLIQPIEGGFEALATNIEVCARARVEDAGSPGPGGPKIEIPHIAIEALMRILGRNKDQNIEVLLGKDSGNGLYFRTKDVFFGTSLSAAHMPAGIVKVFELDSVVSKTELPRQSMLDSVQRANPYCSNSRSGRLVSLNLQDNAITLSAEDDLGEFEEVVPVEGTEGSVVVTFPVGHFANIFRKSSQPALSLVIGTIPTYRRNDGTARYVALIQDGEANGASYIVGSAA